MRICRWCSPNHACRGPGIGVRGAMSRHLAVSTPAGIPAPPRYRTGCRRRQPLCGSNPQGRGLRHPGRRAARPRSVPSQPADTDSYMGLHSPDSALSRHLSTGWTCTSPNGGWSRCCRPAGRRPCQSTSFGQASMIAAMRHAGPLVSGMLGEIRRLVWLACLAGGMPNMRA
jgi:hypothetical protein